MGGVWDVGKSGRRNRKRADGGSVNEVNGKNGKGENQSRRERGNGGGRVGDCSAEKGCAGRAVGNAWQGESRN